MEAVLTKNCNRSWQDFVDCATGPVLLRLAGHLSDTTQYPCHCHLSLLAVKDLSILAGLEPAIF